MKTTPKKERPRATDEEIKRLRDRNNKRSELIEYSKALPAAYGGAQFRNLTRDDDNREVIKQAITYAKRLFENNRQGTEHGYARWKGPNFILTGPSGTGKTTIAWAILWSIWESIYRNEDMRDFIDEEPFFNFFKLVELEQALGGLRRTITSDLLMPRHFPRASGGSLDEPYSGHFEEVEEVISYLKRLDILVIDELALTTPTEDSLKYLYQVIDFRSNAQRPTIVTMNVGVPDAVDRGLIDGRIAYRLSELALKYHVTGKNYRTVSKDPWRQVWKPNLELEFEVDPDKNRVLEKERSIAATRAMYEKQERKFRQSIEEDSEDEVGDDED